MSLIWDGSFIVTQLSVFSFAFAIAPRGHGNGIDLDALIGYTLNNHLPSLMGCSRCVRCARYDMEPYTGYESRKVTP